MNLGYTFRKSAFDNLQHWEIAEQGLMCTDMKTNQQNQLPYSFIQSIRLQFQPYRDFRHNNFRCRITTINGNTIDILSTSYIGFAEFRDEAETYTPFVKALVKKTKSVNPNCMIYLGQAPSAFNGNLVLIVVAVVFAFWMIFSIPMGQSRLLALLLIIIGAWRYLKMSRNINRPQTNHNDEIPDYVLPATQTEEEKTDRYMEKQNSE